MCGWQRRAECGDECGHQSRRPETGCDNRETVVLKQLVEQRPLVREQTRVGVHLRMREWTLRAARKAAAALCDSQMCRTYKSGKRSIIIADLPCDGGLMAVALDWAPILNQSKRPESFWAPEISSRLCN